MDKLVLKAWDENNQKLKDWILSTRQEEYSSYVELLKKTIEIIFADEEDDYYCPDSKRITEIDNGDYQGTLVFVIGGRGYQPSEEDHWCTFVGYGSCSGCDTLQSLSRYENGLPDISQTEGYWTLCLHMVQRMKRMYPKED